MASQRWPESPSQCRIRYVFRNLGGGFVAKHGGESMRTIRSVGLRWPMVLAGAVCLGSVLGFPAAALAQPDQPNLLVLFADWGTYFAAPGGKKVCFALSKPKESKT